MGCLETDEGGFTFIAVGMDVFGDNICMRDIKQVGRSGGKVKIGTQLDGVFNVF